MLAEELHHASPETLFQKTEINSLSEKNPLDSDKAVELCHAFSVARLEAEL